MTFLTKVCIMLSINWGEHAMTETLTEIARSSFITVVGPKSACVAEYHVTTPIGEQPEEFLARWRREHDFVGCAQEAAAHFQAMHPTCSILLSHMPLALTKTGKVRKWHTRSYTWRAAA